MHYICKRHAIYNVQYIGVGTDGVFAGGPHIPYISPWFALRARMLPQFATVCNILT